MERHSNHRSDGTKVDLNASVIVCHFARIEFLIILTSAMDIIEILNCRICLPDRRQTCSLCRHNINADTEISREVLYARSYKFHYFILHITVLKYSTNNSQRNVLRSYAFYRGAFQINSYNTWHIDIIGLVQKLFYKFRTTFTHCHSSKRTITGMGIRAKNHSAAACQHFSGELVNNCLMRWYIHTAISLGTGKSEHMIVFVDGSAYCTQRVVAVRQYIRYRELSQS